MGGQAQNQAINDWKLGDAVSIFSNSMNTFLPGVVVEIDKESKELTVRYWIVQSMEIKYKKRSVLDLNGIKRREYMTEYDPWNMPLDDGNGSALSEKYLQIVRDQLFQCHSELLS